LPHALRIQILNDDLEVFNSCGGDHYKSHKLFQELQHALRIQILNDDLEVFNSCGSKTKLHQLAMFCFTIFKLGPSLLSQVCHMHLLAVCKTLNVVESNFGFVLREFKKELQTFESDKGMLLETPDLPNFRIRATLVSVSTDTKRAHEIGL
jgi:hypothetical protein